MGIIFRLIILGLAIWTGVMWFNTGDFIWWGLSCVILAIVLLASLGMDGSDAAFFDWSD